MAKRTKQNSNAKRLTIASVTMLLSIFTLLKTGSVVTNLYNGIYYLFGSISSLLLMLIIFVCVHYIIDSEYKFYKSRTFYGILAVIISIFLFVSIDYMHQVGINKGFQYYVERLDFSYQWNGGVSGYLLTKPFYALAGNLGVYIVSLISLAIGAYIIFSNFYEIDDDITKDVKEKLKPKKVTVEEQRARREEKRRRKEELLAQRELENAKPIDTSLEIKKEDPKSHMLNVEIKREKDLDYDLYDVTEGNKQLRRRMSRKQAFKQEGVSSEKHESLESFERELDQVTEQIVDGENAKELSQAEIDIFAVEPKKTLREQKIEKEQENQKQSVIKPEDEKLTAVAPKFNIEKEEKKSSNPITANVNVMKIEKGESKTASSDSDYIIPPMELLSDGMKDLDALKRLEAVASENAQILEVTLQSFNLKAKISNVSIGPNITKYELQPEIGTKVNRFSSLSNDLAMALAATSIRIEAPIPGKAAVGIEIPNKEMLSVSLKEVLMSHNNDMEKKLQVALGKDITGESIFMEINKTPHMLVAGATGSGKSVSINSFIISILLKATPDEVKMIMIDPKKVELAPYNGIPHLLTPVVTEPKRAAVILKKMVAEMENRYELFSKTNTRNIEGFNTKIKRNNPDNFKNLPYIVIIIDELADLMMVASNEVETSIARLAQMARAAGIHLVIATQRPSTDVITGLIKSNIPTRLSFSVSSSIDSRTILDQSGAEKLLGKGDMLYAANGSNNLERIQGTFVSDEEIIEIVEYINNQEYGKEEIEKERQEFEQTIETATENSERDVLFEEAVDVIISSNSASTSLLQRRLKIGFNRASQIMEQMEEAGIVSANEGTKPRKILIEACGDEDEQY